MERQRRRVELTDRCRCEDNPHPPRGTVISSLLKRRKPSISVATSSGEGINSSEKKALTALPESPHPPQHASQAIIARVDSFPN